MKPSTDPRRAKPDDDVARWMNVTGGKLLRAPAGWEKLLVDAAVIGGAATAGCGVLKGLEQELKLQGRGWSKRRPDDPRLPPKIERRLEQLKRPGNSSHCP